MPQVPVEHGIHLGTGRRPPVRQRVLEPEVLVERRKLLVHQRLETGALDLFGPIERSGRSHSPVDPGVEEVELRVRREAALRPPVEDREGGGEQKVTGNLGVPGDRLAFDRALARHLGDVQESPLGKGRCLQEPGERAHVPYQPFPLYLFPQVRLHVGFQECTRIRCVQRGGQAAGEEGAVQADRGTELERRQGVHVERECASGEQVRAFPTQASGARSRNHESLPPFHHEPLDLVQHPGNALHLVDDDPVGIPGRDVVAVAASAIPAAALRSAGGRCGEQPQRLP